MKLFKNTLWYQRYKAWRKTRNGKWFNLILWIIIPMTIVLLLFSFVLYKGRVPTGSMNDTISTNSGVIADRHAYDNSGPEKGDIIVFEWVDEREESKEKINVVKRVTATPGDRVIVYRDGTKGNPEVIVISQKDDKVNEIYMTKPSDNLSSVKMERENDWDIENGTYLVANTMTNTFVEDIINYQPEGKFRAIMKDFEVDENTVFVTGDNRNDSYDARYWQDPLVKYDSIEGRVFFTYSFGKMKFKWF